MKIGDVVTLKSGGPKMTVIFVEASLIRTLWFDVDNNVRGAEFEIVALEIDDGNS